MSRHAAFCLSRFSIKEDGKTPYEKLNGRKWNRPMVCFGEKIFFRPLDAYRVEDESGERKIGDLGRRVMSGRYIGTHGRLKCRCVGDDNTRCHQRKYDP